MEGNHEEGRWQHFFDQAPATIERYHPPNHVTRANFISFVSRSFLVSRGNAERQTLWLEYIQARTSFPYREVFELLLAQDGWDGLGENERTAFLADFERVKGHHEGDDTNPPVSQDFYENTRQEFDNELYEQTASDNDTTLFESRFGKLANIQSERDFLYCLDILCPVND